MFSSIALAAAAEADLEPLSLEIKQLYRIALGHDPPIDGKTGDFTGTIEGLSDEELSMLVLYIFIGVRSLGKSQWKKALRDITQPLLADAKATPSAAAIHLGFAIAVNAVVAALSGNVEEGNTILKEAIDAVKGSDNDIELEGDVQCAKALLQQLEEGKQPGQSMDAQEEKDAEGGGGGGDDSSEEESFITSPLPKRRPVIPSGSNALLQCLLWRLSA